MSRHHLLIAGTSRAWGEMVYGIRLAWELVARGDRVSVLAPPAMEPLLRGTPFRFGRLEQQALLAPATRAAIRDQRVDVLVLIDLATVFMHLKGVREDATFLSQVPIPVLALDVWDLPRTDMVWDVGGFRWTHSPHALAVTRRLVTSPLAPPAGDRVYRALPDDAPDPTHAAALRAAWGIKSDERVVFFPTATWQQVQSNELDPAVRRLSEQFPAWIAHLLARAAPKVHVVHVGARPIEPLARLLGERYHVSSALPPAEFNRMLAASDLLLTFNTSATTIGSAIAAGVPILLGINSVAATTLDEARAKLGSSLDADAAAWLAGVMPLHPFEVWPMGLHSFLAPVLRDNPLLTAVERVEVLDVASYRDALDRLLWNAEARDAARTAQRAYAARVRALPSGADLVESYLR